MAFDPKNMENIWGNGQTISGWAYVDPDVIANVTANGYFDAYADFIKSGDHVNIKASDANGIFIATNTSGAITLEDGTLDPE